MGRFFREDWKLLKKGGRNMFLFEISYKMIAVAIIYPLVILMMNLAIKMIGVRYLTNEYIVKVITNPLVIFALVCSFLLVALYVLYEMIYISSCYEFKKKQHRLSLFQVAHISWKIFSKVFKFKNWILIPFTLISVLAINIVVILNLVMSGTTNNLWASYVLKCSWKSWVIFAFVSLLIYIPVVLGCFTVNFFMKEDESFKACFRKSFRIVKKNIFRIFGTIVIYNIVIVLVIILLYAILSVILIAGVKLLDMAYMGSAVYLSTLRIFRNGVKIFLVLISVPASYTLLCRLYNKIGKDDKHNTLPNELVENKPKRNRIILVILVFVAITLNITYVVMAFNKNPFDKVAILSDIKITAHRGSSLKAPENTMAAFEKAIEDMADYIELDVQQTQDGAIIVMHDPSVYRTTGVNRYVWEMTLEQIEELDAGSFFSQQYAGEKVPTLDEVIKLAKGKTKLNIEIKPSGHDTDLAESVVNIIKDNNFTQDCIITSFDYSTLKKVKEIDKDIEVGYILSVAYGNFYNMDDIDFFSVNASFLSKITVDAIHNAGKQVHAWTVDNTVSIKNLANKGVDNIITDVPIAAKEVIYSRNTSETLINMIKYVFSN